MSKTGHPANENESYAVRRIPAGLFYKGRSTLVGVKFSVEESTEFVCAQEWINVPIFTITFRNINASHRRISRPIFTTLSAITESFMTGHVLQFY